MNVRSPQLNRVPQYLVDEANDRSIFRRSVEVGIFQRIFIHHLERRVTAQRIDCVCAHPQSLLDLTLDRLSRSQHGLEIETREGLERVQTLGCEQAAGCYFHDAIITAKWKQLFLEQNARGNKRQQLTVR